MTEIFSSSFEEKNIYNKAPFHPSEAKLHMDQLIHEFKEYYNGILYREEPSVAISSGVDKTVRFIGSHISVFKPYLENNNVPDPGLFMVQDCIRTRNQKSLLLDTPHSYWGSYFTSIGTISYPNRLQESADEVFSFFDRLSIHPDQIRLRVNSVDEELLEICRGYNDGKSLEVDTEPLQYYRHKIGMERIRGRNFNFALQDPHQNQFHDIGNFIILEDHEKTLGIETALGTSTILKQLYSLDHVQDCTPVLGLQDIQDLDIRRKLEDSIMTSIVLYKENLRPNSSKNKNRILKKYVEAIAFFQKKIELSSGELLSLLKCFEQNHYPDTEPTVYKDIIQYIETL